MFDISFLDHQREVLWDLVTWPTHLGLSECFKLHNYFNYQEILSTFHTNFCSWKKYDSVFYVTTNPALYFVVVTWLVSWFQILIFPFCVCKQTKDIIHIGIPFIQVFLYL